MQLSLRPYVTTGIALVGATVIAAAPMQPVMPADIQVPNPAVEAVERGVQLTANEIQTAINNAIFNFVARPTVASAELLGKLLAPVIGAQQAFLLPVAALGLAGPLISGGGSIGTALQEVVDSNGLEDLVVNLIGAPGIILDGLVNGGYGPNLAPLVASQVAAILSAALHTNIPPALIGTVLAGGLLSEGGLLGLPIPPLGFELPGTIPTLQGLVEQLFGLLSPATQAKAASTQLAAQQNQPIEDGVNQVLFAATALTLRLVTLAAPLLEPILGDDAAAFLALGTLGLVGPLISGTGAFGEALQNLADSSSLEELATNFIGAPGTVIDGAVNGGYGPNLLPLLTDFIPPVLPLNPIDPKKPPFGLVTGVFAPGLISNPGFLYDPALMGLGLRIDGGAPPVFNATLLPPSTTAVLQGLVERLFGALPSNQMAASTLKAPASEQNDFKISSEPSNAKLAEDNGADLEGQTDTDDPAVTPKKHRHLINVDVFKPLGNLGGAKKDTKDNVSAANSNNDTPVKHRIGTPVRDLIHKVLGGSHEKDDNDDEGTTDQSTDDASE